MPSQQTKHLETIYRLNKRVDELSLELAKAKARLKELEDEKASK